MRTKPLWQLLIVIPLLFFVAGYIVYPLIQLVNISGLQAESLRQLVSAQVLQASVNSFLLALVSVAGSLLVGTYLAYTLHYKKVWAKGVLSILIILPMAIPPMVSVMAWLFLLSGNGFLARMLGLKGLNFTGWTPIIIIHLYSFYPLFYLFVNNALKNIDNSTIEAANMLGAGKFKTFCSVILPQLKPALSGAALLTFMASMASFSAPFIFANSTRFLTTEIYYAKINGNMSLSASLSLMLAVVSLVTLLGFRAINKQTVGAGSKGTLKTSALSQYRNYSIYSTAALIGFAFIVALPLLSLAGISLIPENALMEGNGAMQFSLSNYVKMFSEAEFLSPLLNSLQASVIALLLTTVLGVLAAQIIRGKRSALKSVLEAIVSIPFGIPGTVIGICLILSFNQPTLFSFNRVLVGTFWILPVAYTIRNLPLLTQSVVSGLNAVNASVEEAARALGAGPLRTWWSVTAPLVFPFIVEGALLVFINSFGEFVATVLLYNYSSKTLPIEIYAQMRLYNNGMAAAYGIMVFIVVITIIYFTRRTATRYVR